MNETEAVEFLLNEFIAENKELATRAGMSESDFDAQMAQSIDSLRYMFGNIYTKMKEAKIVA